MKKIVILGAGGHAHVIADIVKAEGNMVVAFLDDDENAKDRSGPINDYKKYLDCDFIIGIGLSKIRNEISSLDLHWHTAIHPSSIISSDVQIGEGTVVMPNVVINTGSVIGMHCIINSGAIVEHNNNILDYTHISVGAKLGGTVNIGSNCWIGIGSVIKNNISVCDDAIIGAGTVVVKDIKEKGTYVGVPARKIK